MSDSHSKEASTVTSRRRAWLYATFLLMIPGLLWAAALVAPFLPLAASAKVWLAASLAVIAEIVFWVAALFLGKEVASRYRRYLDPRNWSRGGRR